MQLGSLKDLDPSALIYLASAAHTFRHRHTSLKYVKSSFIDLKLMYFQGN